jgi:glycerol-3-phosphate acyltransferase PlsY
VTVLSVLLAYLCGSVPFASLVARWWGTPDLRRVGSGNLGATNVARTAGPGAGAIVALLDIGKGAFGVVAAGSLTQWNVTATAVAAVATIVGHVYPVWSGLRGGKGVATGFGAFAILEPMAAWPAFGAFVIGAAATRYVSVGSVTAAVTLPVAAYAVSGLRPVVLAAIATAAIVIFRHRSNVVRLLAGTERRFGAGA